MNRFLFGNSAIVLLLSHGNIADYVDAVKLTHNLKLEIRNTLPDTRNGTCLLAIDVNKLNIQGKISKDNGYLTLTNENKTTEFDSLLSQKGRWKGYFLHYVHCANPTVEDFKRELKIMSDNGIFQIQNEISDEAWTLCKKLGSCRRI